jgi:hypothetical protein
MDWESNQESYEDQGQTRELANDFASTMLSPCTMHCSEQGNGSNGIFGSD